MMPECGVLSFVLHFFYYFWYSRNSQRAEPRTKPLGQRTLWFFTLQFWDSARFSPLTLEVQDTAGHKSHERRGGTHGSGGRRNVASGC
jgi:hypothetical protein